jgi:hypothetical protein
LQVFQPFPRVCCIIARRLTQQNGDEDFHLKTGGAST